MYSKVYAYIYVYIYIFFFFQILFPYRLLQNIFGILVLRHLRLLKYKLFMEWVIVDAPLWSLSNPPQLKDLFPQLLGMLMAGSWVFFPEVCSWLKRPALSNNMSPFQSEYNHYFMREYSKPTHCFNLKQFFRTIPAPEPSMASSEVFVVTVSQPTLFLGSILLPSHPHSCWFQ